MAKIPSVATRKLNQGHTQTALRDPVCIMGSFELDDASSTANVLNVRGDGFQVEHTAVGVFLVTFTNPYPELVCANVTVQANAAGTLTDLDAQAGVYDPAAGTMEILTYDEIATPALDDEDGPRINFCCTFRRRDSLKNTRSS